MYMYLEVVIEVSKFNDDVTGNDWKGKVNLKKERQNPHTELSHSHTELSHREYKVHEILVVKLTLTSPCAAVREQLLAVNQVPLLQW